MHHLWAPWRLAYILGKKPKGCFICRIRRSRQDRPNLIVARSPHSFAVLNRYPYNNGHVLIVPNRHAKTLSQLSEREQMDLLKLTTRVMDRIAKTMKPEGANLGINFGRAAGAGAPNHLHIHLVPRWSGDTNFMPVIGRTRVILETLESVYRKLAFRPPPKRRRR